MQVLLGHKIKSLNEVQVEINTNEGLSESMLKDLYKNEIELKAQISLLRYLLGNG